MLRIIGQIIKGQDAKTVVGYRLLDEESLACADMGIAGACLQLRTKGFSHGVVTAKGIELTDGSINSLPLIDEQTKKCIGNRKYILVKTRVDGDKKMYYIANYEGRLKWFDEARAKCMAEAQGFVNCKFFIRNEKTVVSAIKGSLKEEKPQKVAPPVKVPEGNEVFYTPKGIEVIKNPSNQQYQQIYNEFKKEYPRLAACGEPYCRITYDKQGNTYIWKSISGMHMDVEPHINYRYKTITNQNKYF